ncbi:MAG: cupin domain-containing protein [Desulfobacterota bacterium]|nr:cupin domain-containing protein [Thermodesulfobacteriota bacterium]MDW8002513.1 cupin domain-containing protein [Deltaproteobacteria bacterium]
MVDLGMKLRQLREAKGLTLRELSLRVGCTPAFISQVENGKTEPSISTLKKIASALGVNIVDFFMDNVNDEDVVTKEEDRIDIHLKRWDAKIQSLVKNVTNKRMQPFYTVIKPGGGSHGMYSHDGEEFGFVIKGEMVLRLNDKTHIIRQGESFYFSSRIPHDWVNEGKEEVHIIWVITPPTF